MCKRLGSDFFKNDALSVAPGLIGKLLARKMKDGGIIKLRINETEIYRGEEDAACHARFGRTPRTSVMYEAGGLSYVYMIYGIHFLFNVVTGAKNQPQAVLIRSTVEYNGPGKLTKALGIDKSLNGIDISTSTDLWLEDDGFVANYKTAPRVGIDYAKEPYKSINWRFIMVED